MLVISNGAFKSGSTWLYNIIAELSDFKAPPEKYLNNAWLHPSLDENRLPEFIRKIDFQNDDYLVKNHISRKKHKALVFGVSGIKILNITRDVRDIVVSSYYHYLERGMTNLTIDQFYHREAKFHVFAVKRYNELWREERNIHSFKYENLKASPFKEIKRIALALNKQPKDEVIKIVVNATNINALRKKYSEKPKGEARHFRSGNVGDFRTHLNDEIIENIEHIEKYGMPLLRFYLWKFNKRYGNRKYLFK